MLASVATRSLLRDKNAYWIRLVDRPHRRACAASAQDHPLLTWTDDLRGKQPGKHSAMLRSSKLSVSLPRQAIAVDDNLRASKALALVRHGTALVWKGNCFHNAKALLANITRRVTSESPSTTSQHNLSLRETFHNTRRDRSRLLAVQDNFLLNFDAGYHLAIPRSPAGLADACEAAFGSRADAPPFLVSLQHLLGIIGAYETRKTGVTIAALGGERVYPHYGVFAPIRGEYLELVTAALREFAKGRMSGRNTLTALDVGTGTGVLTALLLRHGTMGHVTATDNSARAIECARDNLERLGYLSRVTLERCDLFPPDSQAELIVCNPPWVGPAKPLALMDLAVYDEGCTFLKGFLARARSHLTPSGEVWLILSDLSERIGLRTRQDLEGWIQAGGLRIAGETSTRPTHSRSRDVNDPLHEARSAEVTTLYRLLPA